jgi:hypothetical protein
MGGIPPLAGSAFPVAAAIAPLSMTTAAPRAAHILLDAPEMFTVLSSDTRDHSFDPRMPREVSATFPRIRMKFFPLEDEKITVGIRRIVPARIP